MSGRRPHALRALLYALAGGFVMAIVFLVMHLNNRPDLKVWHTARLKQEFKPLKNSQQH